MILNQVTAELTRNYVAYVAPQDQYLQKYQQTGEFNLGFENLFYNCCLDLVMYLER